MNGIFLRAHGARARAERNCLLLAACCYLAMCAAPGLGQTRA